MHLADKIEFCPSTEARALTPDLDGLIRFLKSADPATAYDHTSPVDCLLCRFVAAIDGEAAYTPWLRVMEVLSIDSHEYSDIREIAYPDNRLERIQTYSQALTRAARSALSKGAANG